jgi:hypothetical protein
MVMITNEAHIVLLYSTVEGAGDDIGGGLGAVKTRSPACTLLVHSIL